MDATKLREISSEFKEEIDGKLLENTEYAISHFTKDLEAYAKRGKFQRTTTCLVHKFGNQYHCQTENDGEGFTVMDIKGLMDGLNKLGFEVIFEKKKGYCPLTIKW